MATSRTPVLIAVPLLLIESTLLTICFALMSQNLLPPAKSEKTRLLALVITCFAIVFTVGAGLICLDYGMETSELACEATYVLCVVFWLAIKSLVCLYFYEKLQVAKGVPVQDRTVVGELYFANTIGMLLPALFVIWIVVEFHYHELRNGACRLGFRSFIANIYLIFHNLLLNIYISLSFLRLPPPSLQDMFKPNPARYAWCNIATCTVPIAYLIVLLVSDGIQDGWIFVGTASVDVGIAVVILGALEGRRDVRPVEHVIRENWACEDCERSAKNGDGPGLSFFDLSLVLANGADDI